LFNLIENSYSYSNSPSLCSSSHPPTFSLYILIFSMENSVSSRSNNSLTNEYVFKFLIIGDAGVGKTSILQRYTEDEFTHGQQPTIGVEFGSKSIELDESTKIKLQIWDTAGQESFRTVVKSFYRDAQCVFLVYNVKQRETFESLSHWLSEVSENGDQGIIQILIGNQTDEVDGYSRQVEYEEGVEFMKENGIHFFFETSALKGTNIDLAFVEAARLAFLFLMKDRKEGRDSLFTVTKKSSISLINERRDQIDAGNCAC